MANKERSVLAALLMTAGVIGIIIVGSVFAVKHLGLHFDLSRLFPKPQMDEPRAPLKDLPVARGPDETIEVGRMAELRQWLENERFEALNSALDDYQNAFETDYTREFALHDAFQSFSATMPSYEVLFDKWTRAHPTQYQPYLAAAHYYYARGWESRGFKWRKETSDEQLRGMRLNFSYAEEKLTKALKNHTQALEDINYAISLRPTICRSYLVRAKIHFSQEAYDEAIEDLKTIYDIRPEDPSAIKWSAWASRKLNSQGHRLFKTDLEGAIEFYDISLSFEGNNPETRYWRGVANYKLEQYGTAAIDFKDCIEIDPHYFEAYRMLDYILAREGQWETIISYWDAFLELEADHAEAYLERSGAHYHNKNIQQAKADLIKACDLGSQKACRQYEKIKDRM